MRTLHRQAFHVSHDIRRALPGLARGREVSVPRGGQVAWGASFPEHTGAHSAKNGDRPRPFLTNPKNVAVGVQRQFMCGAAQISAQAAGL